MSRVRIYELAKEVGVGAKDLVSKLMEQGQDVKGPSSTVDDDVAEKVRKTYKGGLDREAAEKKAEQEAGAALRRKATIIRRPAKSDTEVPVVDGSESAPSAVELSAIDTGDVDIQLTKEFPTNAGVAGITEHAESVADAVVPVHVPDSSSVDSDGVSPIESVVRQHKEETVVTFEPRAAGANDRSSGHQGAASAVDRQHREGDGRYVAKEQKGLKKEAPKDPSRKNFARVVGTIEIPVDDRSSAPVRTAKRPVKGPEVKEPVVAAVVPVRDPAAADFTRQKKKGRREDEPEDQDDRRGVKGGKKGKKSGKYSSFGSDYMGGGRLRGKKGGRGRKELPLASEMKASKKRIKVYETITVADLAARMRVKASDVIAKLMALGVMATINQSVDVDTAMLLAADFGYEVEQGVTGEIEMQMLDEGQTGGDTMPRPPVVTVMGHVDHGKTSILDAIRKTDVAVGEAGGITQHIGAYHVKSPSGDVTFVDTPGHAAFTEMRARGAQVTDLVVLVVAADDGVMDQTREAIRHAQAAEVPILVCVNKIDKDNADIDRVKRELSEFNLAPEEWGGQTIYCQTSAKKNVGIDELLENIQLMAEILELRADPNRKAKGRVIEAKLDKGRGPVATVMVQEGTLRVGDFFVAGIHSGKVRAMFDDKGRKMSEAGPSIPVEVQGLAGVPSAGDEFIVVTDEKMAKSVSHVRALKARESELGAGSKISLDKLFEQMNEGEVKELRVILRADVQGTLEAFAKSAEELSTDEIRVKVLHEGTGTITESDILLASASQAIIIGFNVRPTAKVKELAVKENIDIRAYDVIYHALDDIRKAMVGMLDPTFEENVIGNAEVRETFSVPKIGVIAGCGVTDGKIVRNAKVRVVRDGVVVYTGKISSLRRFKDDVKEVLTGFECGIGVEHYNDLKIGDQLEAFVLKQVEATLS